MILLPIPRVNEMLIQLKTVFINTTGSFLMVKLMQMIACARKLDVNTPTYSQHVGV
jgi:hypothetical protein